MLQKWQKLLPYLKRNDVGWVFVLPPSDPGVRLPSHRAPLDIRVKLWLVVDPVRKFRL